MTEHETYVQALHALRRLRSKTLLSGAVWRDGEVCAIGALAVHLASVNVMRKISKSTALGWGYIKYRHRIMQENDWYYYGDNTETAKKSRYAHMVRWLEQRIEETAP